jgi:two-component system OmpR family response regulator
MAARLKIRAIKSYSQDRSGDWRPASSREREFAMRILLVEDDHQTADYIRNGFSQSGLACDVVDDGREAMLRAADEDFDVAVVDRMLPGLDGLSLVKSLRAAGVSTPVLFLTSIGGVDDRVEGLEAGGDDYLVKPFAFSELLARVNALLRRPAAIAEKSRLRVHDLEMDLIRRRVTRAGQDIDLQPKEFTLLETLMEHEGRVLTKTMLLERVWNFHFDPKTSVVETHISRLRSKIDKPFDAPLLHTVRNLGYSLHAPR